ncbi:conserved hypothetical protein [Treponema pallidum subsp. pallidum str. Chicago]|nr:conserved hypothetical protein [Treponema pallidum subsp. pallidum str. Chicago]
MLSLSVQSQRAPASPSPYGLKIDKRVSPDYARAGVRS